MADILTRRESHFVFWCPKQPSTPPELLLGRIQNGNPPQFQQLVRKSLNQATVAGTVVDSLWELDAATLGLVDGETYHYWFEVDNTQPGSTGRVQTVDPCATTVDYRLSAPANPLLVHPSSVIGWSGGKLVARDPNDEHTAPLVADFDQLPTNNQTVIYELPTAWSLSTGSNEFERAVGTFRDIRALVEKREGANFAGISVLELDPPYLVQLGANAVELLPPADSTLAREWGYGTSHYLAPDYELGYPEGHLSPTSNQDLTGFINDCHKNGIRIFLDVVLGFMREEAYRRIDFDDFYLENPRAHAGDPDAYNSRNGGGREFRNPYGASCPRYARNVTTYDPISGQVRTLSPARQHMLTFLVRWMEDFQIDGVRMDSVENVANWDFVRDFKDLARTKFQERYPGSADADAKFLVVGEELTMPKELLTQGRLDGLWNERFQGFARAAILGEGHDHSFFETVQRAINCLRDGVFSDGAQAINYLTSHDVEGFRKERLYNFLKDKVPLANSRPLFDSDQIQRTVEEHLRNEGARPSDDNWTQRVSEGMDALILHLARLRRVKLAFVCQLTAVGIPMILAGEEFADEHDLFNSRGNVTHEGGKQVDPVNFGRFNEVERRQVFDYVRRLVHLRTTHPALGLNETKFLHFDPFDGKQVVAWQRGSDNDPVVVVANFSDYTTPHALSSGAEYFTPNWPPTPAGKEWFEVTRNEAVPTGRHNREPVFAWEAKVYRLRPTGGG